MENEAKLTFEIAATDSRLTALQRMNEMMEFLWKQEYADSAITETLVEAATDLEKALKNNLPHIYGKKNKDEFRKLATRINKAAANYWQLTLGG